ncbi:hypothetical protein, partial [Streptomyces sp. NRRL B-24572]|uniref:hypothetical protein n=1 Tax=Streptomyces sp. NRRL B-24572 TaxID=1962156 RepID=UPI001C4E7FFD
MRLKYGRAIACLVVSAMAGTAIPQVAYAAPAADDGDTGVFDALSGWLSDTDDKAEPAKPVEPATGGTPV